MGTNAARVAMMVLLIIVPVLALGGCTSTAPALKQHTTHLGKAVLVPPQPPPPILEEGFREEAREEVRPPVQLPEVVVVEARETDDPELLNVLGGDIHEVRRLHRRVGRDSPLLQDIRKGSLRRDARGFYYEVKSADTNTKFITEGLLLIIERARNPFRTEDVFGPNPFKPFTW